MRLPLCGRIRVFMYPFQLLSQLNDFHHTFHEFHTMGGHPNVGLFNFLKRVC
jgi:hypothetical protein